MQVQAKDVKKDDVIEIGGVPVVVGQNPFGTHKEDGIRHTYISWTLGGGWFPEDAEFTVTRPDPDAELIEVMAKAICDTYAEGAGAPGWSDSLPNGSFEHRAEYRDEARAALAAAREAGLL